jgi:hypothetical protein
MDLHEFRQELLENVRLHAEVSKDFVRASFVDEVSGRLTEAEEIADFMSCRFEGTGSASRKLQIDGYCFDETDGSMSLVVASFSNDDQLGFFNAAETRRLFGLLRAFVEEALAGKLTDGSIEESQAGYGLANDLIATRSLIARFRFYLVSDGQLNTRVKDWPVEEVAGVPTEFHIWDIARFFTSHQSATGRDDITIDFSDFDCNGLLSLKADSSDGDYQAYLSMIPGDVLAGIYDTYGSRLLEGNVRSFLSSKGKINAKIQATVKNKPEMFFAFNNGIAATAEKIETKSTDRGLVITSATNLQIVNGGQTTASLAFAKRKDGADLSRISVQMKLSVLPPDRAGELIPEIARYANSQNKVSDADFFANHPFHVRFEELSRRLFTPPAPGRQHGTHWFYERARGQYLNEQSKLTVAQKKQFLLQNPKTELLLKTDIAKLENSWRCLPHKVSLGAQKNFAIFAEWVAKSWNDNNEQFNEQYFRNIVSIAILFRHTESLVSQQPWYQGGYRANVVTYTLAKLRNAISEQHLGLELNLRTIWDRQSVSQELNDQLIVTSKLAFKALTDPMRPKENVTEWAKMQGCWDSFKAEKLPILKSFTSQLVGIGSVMAGDKAAKVAQNLDRGIETQIAVLEIPGGKWAKLKDWGSQRGLLSATDQGLLRTASQMPTRLPTDRQCAQLWQIRTRLIAEGFSD